MKVRLIAAACAALIPLGSAPALAAEPITAKLQRPVAEKLKIVAGGAVFVCEADACVAASPGSRTFSAGVCKAIAAKVGPVVSFTGAKALEPARLADCNGRGALAPGSADTRLAAQ